MKASKQKKWQHETTGYDGKPQLFVVNIFDYKRHNTEKSICLTQYMVRNIALIFIA